MQFYSSVGFSCSFGYVLENEIILGRGLTLLDLCHISSPYIRFQEGRAALWLERGA